MRVTPRRVVRKLRRLADPRVRRSKRDDAQTRALIAFAVRSDATTVDVGAHKGAVLDLLVARAPAGRHVAFEAIPELAEGLRASHPGIDVRGVAVSDVAGEAEFNWVKTAPGYSGLREVPLPTGPGLALKSRKMPAETNHVVERITVPTVTLDEALDGYDPEFVKIDVEGAAHLVLLGGLTVLRRCQPVIMFEFGKGSGPLWYDFGPDQMHGLVAGDLGMQIFDMDGVGPIDRREFAEIYEATSRWNFVAAR